MNRQKGFPADIYKTKSFLKCSNGGLSEFNDKCMIVSDNVPLLFNIDENDSIVAIVERDIQGKKYLTAYPVDRESGEIDRNVMDGGSFIYSIDSRFRKISQHPIPLHDRKE